MQFLYINETNLKAGQSLFKCRHFRWPCFKLFNLSKEFLMLKLFVYIILILFPKCAPSTKVMIYGALVM